MRFGKRGKLCPRFVGPYEVVSKVGLVAYMLKVPPKLSRIHDTFHVSMLRKYILDPSHVLREQPVELKENLTYEEIPVQIVDRKEQVLRSKVIPLVKVLWKNHEREAATREPESQMRRQYLNYFSIEVFSFPLSLVCSFRGQNVLKEGGFVTLHPMRMYDMCNRRVAYVHQGLP